MRSTKAAIFIPTYKNRYDELLKEFLTPYALNKTEKSEENNKQ